ncbi:hypothetical protein EHS13_16710 [Paenibacillus psychroresistens]|uniref:Uncharacterized protein n=1 Tax=Paenibacillus psychroresistens TaxID=1778678 RepID=A0A6B8RLV0_9BACL|nr:hypothetical protein [Paenibacillus psychroresistens]QGQ96406.1 hypothetical protein EHS13_16710 [Paenibacillus psychroresistens]
MDFILYIIGYFIIAVAVLYGFGVNKNLTSSDLSIIVNMIIGGVFFLAMGKIVEVLVKIEKKLPERLITNEFSNIEFFVKSNDFEVYDSSNETYQYFILDGNEFIQARVFKNYLEANESSFIYRLPNRGEIKLTVYKEYSQLADMFSKNNIIFVKLSSLNISLIRQGNDIRLRYL